MSLDLKHVVLEAVRRYQPAIFKDIYGSVTTKLGPYPHESVHSAIAALEKSGEIRKSRIGGTTPHWMLRQKGRR